MPRKRPRRRPADPRKRSVCLDADVITEIEAQAERQGRSKAWIAQQAWLIARDLIRKTPAPQRKA